MFVEETKKRLDRLPTKLHPYDEWRRTKQAMREASRTTLHAALHRRPTCPAQRLTALIQLSAGRARADSLAVRGSMRSLLELTEAIRVGARGTHIFDHTRLDASSADIVRAAAKVSTELLDGRHPRHDKPNPDGRRRAHERWKNMWLPFGRRVALIAIPPPPPDGQHRDHRRRLD